jgi:hypothetical protein
MVSSEKQIISSKGSALERDAQGKIELAKLYDLLYSGDIVTKRRLAENLFRIYGEDLQKENRVALVTLMDLQQAVQRQMLAMGLDRICSQCAQQSCGGCCSMTIAAETDALQLLANMLAGVSLTFRQTDNQECCYLGDQGCIFLFKPMFCLNYLCSKITGCVQSDSLRILEKKTGALLQAQHDMDWLLIDFFKGRI